MTEPFDAVLAEVYALPKASQCKALADRLAAAHAAEVAERDARIAELEADKNAMFIRAREWATRSGEQEQRAEAAEARVQELEAIGRRIVDAFRAHGIAKGIVADSHTRKECESAMIELDTAMQASREGR